MTTNDSEVATTESASDAPAREDTVKPETGSEQKDRTRRKHGKSFVYLGLKECDDALRKIDPHEKQMSIQGFARALGHNAPKGRFNHKLDALESFTLIEREPENVRLTPLAIDMLYGGSESAKAKARAMAFLAYADFKKVFVECPKGQDNQRSHIEGFIRAKLGIVNEVDRFIKLFLESAGFAGLLEGTPNPKAKVIRLRTAPMSAGQPPVVNSMTSPSSEEYAVLPLEEVETCLEAVGLSDYRERAEVRQRATGTFKLTVSEGKITIEIDRPIRIVINPDDLMGELPLILKAMQQKGLKA